MTPRRAFLALGALLVLPLPAAAQATPATPPRRRPQQTATASRQRRPASPPPPEPPPAPVARGEPAPVPNRDMEAPRSRLAGNPAPQLNPTLIDPAEPRVGATADPHGPQAREDRLLRNPAPGARLRVPFAY